MSEVNILVFSKDRAMQLDLLLRSFKHFVPYADDYRIDVLYRCSSESFHKGYQILASRVDHDVHFTEERKFRLDVVSLVNPRKPSTVFFVDDTVFKNPFDFFDEQHALFATDPSILCRSLRLHPGLTYCYTRNKPMRAPTFASDGSFFWRGEDGDFGYPMSLDGHIFRTRDILPYLLQLEYRDPNTLEDEMSKTPLSAPKMVCYGEAVILNIPINRVQSTIANRHGNIPAEYLNDLYLSGKRLALEPLKGIKNISCHQEVEIGFVETCEQAC